MKCAIAGTVCRGGHTGNGSGETAAVPSIVNCTLYRVGELCGGVVVLTTDIA